MDSSVYEISFWLTENLKPPKVSLGQWEAGQNVGPLFLLSGLLRYFSDFLPYRHHAKERKKDKRNDIGTLVVSSYFLQQGDKMELGVWMALEEAKGEMELILTPNYLKQNKIE